MGTGKNQFMLKGKLAKKGYDWWWHSFVGINKETSKEKAFFIEYYIVNPALGGTEPIFGQLEQNKKKGIKPSYVMIKAGCWGDNAKQIHNFFGIDKLQCNEQKLELSVEHNYLSEKFIKGSVNLTKEECNNHPEYMSDYGSMSWELKVNKKISYDVGYGTSPIVRKLNAFEMFWHVEGMKTEYDGVVIIDGEEYEVIPEKSYGYADKNWGSNYTSPWVWVNSNNLTSKITGKQLLNSSFDAGGGKPKAFGISFNRKILISMYYEGKNYEYNFSKPWLRSKVDFDKKEDENYIYLKIKASNRESILEANFRCKKDGMIFINYEAPDGTKLHNKLWNGGNAEGNIRLINKHTNEIIDDIICENGGFEYGEY